MVELGNTIAADQGSRSNPRLLIVETDATLRHFLCSIGAQCSQEVIAVESGLSETIVDDHTLVVYNTHAGWDAVVRFRQQCPAVPIIVLLSPSAGVNAEAAAVIQPVAALTIPFQSRAFKEAILQAIASFDDAPELAVN